MKAKLLRAMEQRNPDYDRGAAILAGKSHERYTVQSTVHVEAGTTIDHPEAWRLVRMGVAEPEDEECRKAAGLTNEQIEYRASRYDRLDRGMATGVRALDAAAPAAADED